MKRTSIFALLSLVSLFSIIILLRPRSNSENSLEVEERTTAQSASETPWIDIPWQERIPTPPEREQPASVSDPRFHYRMDGFNEYRDGFTTSQMIASAPDERARIEHIEKLFSQFKWAFRAVPVGSENAEITQRLLGDNPKHLVFIPHDADFINSRGEMLDLQGTPYFFHPESDSQIGIRSAGNDRKLWTNDDLVNQL